MNKFNFPQFPPDSAEEMISQARHVLAFTGAGISTGAGTLAATAKGVWDMLMFRCVLGVDVLCSDLLVLC